MDLKDQLNIDILRFFEQIENQSQNDKIQTLRNLFDKYMHLNTADYIMDYHDLNMIVSNAKTIFAQKTFPAYLGDKKIKVMESEQPNLCVIESVVSHLNKNGCLKKLPKFKYKQDKM